MRLLLLALLACGPKQEAPPAPAPEPVPEPAPEPAPEPEPPSDHAGSPMIGSWYGKACGERTYPREITIRDDGTWSARDLVSPCPPDVQCVWSGIVMSQGTWTRDGEAIDMVETTNDERARPRPTRMEAGEGSATSTEPDGTCVYVWGKAP